MVKSVVEMPSKKLRQIQHNKRRSKTKKWKVKEDKLFDSYQSFMNSNLPKEYNSSQESPHFKFLFLLNLVINGTNLRHRSTGNPVIP